MDRLRQNQNLRILVRAANWVGDAVTTTPALRALRHNFSHAHITLLAKPWAAPVFENNPDIDDIMIYAADGKHGGFWGMLKLAHEIRQRRFDLAVLFPNAFSAALLVFMAGIKKRLGFATDGRGLLLNWRIPVRPQIKKEHLIDHYLGLISGAGLKTTGRKLTIVLNAAEKKTAKKHLLNQGLSGTWPLVGLNPGAAFGTAKRWPAERFEALGRNLVANMNATILIFGGPGEKELGQQIATGIGSGCINLSGQTSLRQAMAFIDQCDLFVTNDSGLMHVAAAFKIPQVVVIGPTNPEATGPANEASHLVQAKGVCHLSPCLKPDCPTDHVCMTAVTVAQVQAAAEAALRRSEKR